MSPTLIHLVHAATLDSERTADIATRSRRVRTARRRADKSTTGR
jgi:hypothetical protein